MRNEVTTLLDLAEKLRHVIIIEWETATDHRVEDDAARPDVDFSATIAQPADDLGCGIVGRSASRLQRKGVAHNVGQTEVNQSNVVVIVE